MQRRQDPWSDGVERESLHPVALRLELRQHRAQQPNVVNVLFYNTPVWLRTMERLQLACCLCSSGTKQPPPAKLPLLCSNSLFARVSSRFGRLFSASLRPPAPLPSLSVHKPPRQERRSLSESWNYPRTAAAPEKERDEWRRKRVPRLRFGLLTRRFKFLCFFPLSRQKDAYARKITFGKSLRVNEARCGFPFTYRGGNY